MSKMIDVHNLIHELNESKDSFAIIYANDFVGGVLQKLDNHDLGFENNEVEELIAILHHYLTKVKAQ